MILASAMNCDGSIGLLEFSRDAVGNGGGVPKVGLPTAVWRILDFFLRRLVSFLALVVDEACRCSASLAALSCACVFIITTEETADVVAILGSLVVYSRRSPFPSSKAGEVSPPRRIA